MDDDKKRMLDYKPDIKYTEDYYSDYDGDLFLNNTDNFLEEDDGDDLFDQDYMDHIQDNIDSLVQLIPELIPELQTAVNQVFKPIFNDWYNNLKDKQYPKEIPSDDPFIEPKPTPPPGVKPPINNDPSFIPDDFDIPDPVQPSVPSLPIYDPHEPNIPIYDIETNPPPSYEGFEDNDDFFLEVDDQFFEPSSPFKTVFKKTNPIEIIELEYVKNLAELYNYYTGKLKKVIGQYYLSLFQTTISTSKEIDDSKIEGNVYTYILNALSISDALIGKDSDMKHIVDAAVRNENTGYDKLCFYLNYFSLESTLYHMKSFKAAYELRLRYEKEKISSTGSFTDTMSNRMLTGLREDYNKKYDTAYINLYKYLNSSTTVLNDVLNNNIVCMKAKEILLKKGGNDK